MNFTWNQAPFIRFIIPFISGIVTAIYLQVEYTILPIILTTLIGFYLTLLFSQLFHLKYTHRWLTGAVINLIFFFFGYLITISKTEIIHKNHFKNYHTKESICLARVTEPAVEKEKSFKTIVEIKQIQNNGQIVETNGKAVVYFSKNEKNQYPDYGDLILFKKSFNEISPPRNPNEFNYRQYLAYYQIYHQTYLKQHEWQKTNVNEAIAIVQFAFSSRELLLHILKKWIPVQNDLGVASAMILGYKEDISRDLINAYISTGAMHVLSVSGLHVGIIFLLINFLLSFLDKNRNGTILKTCILLIVLWFYALITGLTPSVNRAATMFSFMVIGMAFNRQTNIYNTLSVSAFILLLIDPYLIMNVGFQLSYLAVLGIVLFYPKIYNSVYFKNWFLDKIWSITSVSIAAQITTFPLGLFYFHQFPVYFLISNLLVIPAGTLILYFGVLLFCIAEIPVVADVVSWLLNNTISKINYSLLFFEDLPFAKITGISISLWEVWILYFFIISIMLFLFLKKPIWMQIAISMLIFLAIYTQIENYQLKNQKKITVYSIPNHDAIQFTNGKKSIIVTDSGLISDDQKVQFHIQNNLWSMNSTCSFLNYDELYKNHTKENIYINKNFIQFCDKKILIIDSNFSILPKAIKNKIEIDYVVFCNKADAKLQYITDNMVIKNLIFSSAKNKWIQKNIEIMCKELNINFLDVTKNAVVIKI